MPYPGELDPETGLPYNFAGDALPAPSVSPQQAASGIDWLRTIPAATARAIFPALFQGQNPTSPEAPPQAAAAFPSVAPAASPDQTPWAAPSATPAAPPAAPPAAAPAVPPAAAPAASPAGALAGPMQAANGPYPQVPPSAASSGVLSAAPGFDPSATDPLASFRHDVAAGESGGNPNARNGISGASGLYQFTPGTFADFLNSGGSKLGFTQKDINSRAAQEAAMTWHTDQSANAVAAITGQSANYDQLAFGHMFGTGALTGALQADPSTPLSKVISAQAIKNNPTVVNSNMTVGQALQAVGNYYKSRGQGSVPSTDTGDGSAPTTVDANYSTNAAPAAPDTAQQATPQQIDPYAGLSAADQELLKRATRPADANDTLLAIGSGLAGAPTFAAGVSQAAKNLLEQQQLDRTNATGALGLEERIKQAQALAAYRNALINNAGRRLDQGDTRLGINQQGNDIRQQNTDLRRADTEAELSGALPEQKAMITAAQKGADDLNADATSALKRNQEIADIRAVIAKDPTGNDAMTRVQQWAANNLGINIGISPTGYQLADKDISALTTDSIKQASGGRIARMPLGEFNSVKQGLLSMKTNPQAANILLDGLERWNNRVISTASDYQNAVAANGGRTLPVIKPYGGFSGYVNNHMRALDAAQSGQGQPSTSVPPTVQQAPGGGWQSTPSGNKYQIVQ